MDIIIRCVQDLYLHILYLFQYSVFNILVIVSFCIRESLVNDLLVGNLINIFQLIIS